MVESFVSIIVTFHREDYLARTTLLSIERCRKYAESKGLTTQLVATLDNANDLTTAVVSGCEFLRPQDKVLQLAHGDLALSRNSGVCAAEGTWIAVCDGDDLYSKNWVYDGVNMLQGEGREELIIRPQYVVSFGAQNVVHEVLSQEEFALQNSLEFNYYSACSIAHKRVYQNTPYQHQGTKVTGFCYEDWLWNLDTMHAGCINKVARDTSLFYRRKSVGSMLSDAVALGAITKPSPFYDFSYFKNLR